MGYGIARAGRPTDSCTDLSWPSVRLAWLLTSLCVPVAYGRNGEMATHFSHKAAVCRPATENQFNEASSCLLNLFFFLRPARNTHVSLLGSVPALLFHTLPAFFKQFN